MPHPDSPTSPRALRILVLGGAGFIGRHAVAALHRSGMQLAIGSRHPTRHQDAYPFATLHASRFEELLQPGAWKPLLHGVDLVVNCVGILRQRPRETYEDVHHRAPAALAQACAQAGIRFIHTSALGLHENAKSGFLSSKLRGERAIAASGADYCIVRPSLLDGAGGFGARWLRGLARSPVQLVPRGARGRIGAHACDLFHFSPFSYGHWILLQRDNVPAVNRLPQLLGRAPSPVTGDRHLAS